MKLKKINAGRLNAQKKYFYNQLGKYLHLQILGFYNKLAEVRKLMCLVLSYVQPVAQRNE